MIPEKIRTSPPWPDRAFHIKDASRLEVDDIVFTCDMILNNWRRMRVYNVSTEGILLEGLEGALKGVLWLATTYDLQDPNAYLGYD